MPDFQDPGSATAAAYECSPAQKRAATTYIKRRVAPEHLADVLAKLGLSA